MAKASFSVNVRRQLQEITILLETFHEDISKYWAQTINAAEDRDLEKAISQEVKAELKDLDNKVFNKFPVLSNCKSRLILLGDKLSASKLEEYRDRCNEFFGFSPVSPPEVHKRKSSFVA